MSIEELKHCAKCGETKSLDGFSRNKTKPDGYQAYCKCCTRKYNREYYRANRERILEQKHEYHEANREKRVEYCRKYYDTNRETFLANARQYRQDNAEQIRVQMRKWQRNNPEKVRALSNRRRALKLNAEGSHTSEEWLEVVWRQGFACAHCGEIKPLERDHIYPLSKGGTDYISNIQGLCKPCNLSKGAKIPDNA